jgi:5-formyltetrahydrofolate cyclo-ligase
MPDPKPTKDELRRSLRQRRASIGQTQRARAATAAASLLDNLPLWAGCRRLGLYQPGSEEFDCTPIAARARERGIALYLPVMEAQSRLSFAHWADGAELIVNRYGIAEPDTGAGRIAVSALDLVLVPLVGWDRRGGRLGMGGGYYDRALAVAVRPPLVGLAYAAQEVASVPVDSWDIPLDYVLTERELVSVVRRDAS